jgi:hypothetical protein
MRNVYKEFEETLNKLPRPASCGRAAPGILTYSFVCSGFCAPSSRNLPSLATLLQRFLSHNMFRELRVRVNAIQRGDGLGAAV